MRRAGVHLTPEQIAEAKLRYADGWSYGRIGTRFGVHYECIRRALDPDYGAQRVMQNRDRREIRTTGKRNPKPSRENATAISVKEDGAARLAEIPPDTRTLTQRLCGDPIPNDPRRERRPA